MTETFIKYTKPNGTEAVETVWAEQCVDCAEAFEGCTGLYVRVRPELGSFDEAKTALQAGS